MQLTLRIKKRGQNEVMVLLVLVAVFCFGLFLDLLHLPDAFKYLVDIVWIGLLATIIINHFRMPNTEAMKMLTAVLGFWLITLVGLILNGVNPLHYLWGFRNNFRFFVYFFACCMFLKLETATEVLDVFDKLFYLNFVVSLVQFFVLGKKMDYLGGIFGTGVGCNGKTTIFFSIILARSILRYVNGKETLKECLLKCGLALFVAALAELKFFFVLFVFIVAMAMVITRTSIKKLWIIFAAGIGTYAGIILLVAIFPEFQKFFSIGRMLETALSSSGYTGKGDLNRLTAIPIIWSRFLESWPERLFGLGLGSCDTSSFSFLNSAFYEKFGYLRYNWFSSAFMFLETGIFGSVAYLFFFGLIYLYARRREKSGEGMQEACQLASVLAPACILLIIYNASMRVEEAYMMYFVLALPFINKKQNLLKGANGYAKANS